MADTRLVLAGSWSHSGLAFTPIGCGGNSAITTELDDPTETDAQTTYRTAGTFKNLFVRCTAHTGSTVIVTRKAAASQNLTVTITATGIFEDTTHTDTVTAADKWDLSYSALATTLTVIAVTFSAGTNTCSRLTCWQSTSQNFSTASTNYFNALGSGMETLSVESDAKQRIRKAGTLTNLMVNVLSDTAAASTVRSRIGGVNGALTITVASNQAAGILEDTTHTDSLSVGNDANYEFSTGTGSTSISINIFAVDFTSTTGDSVCSSADTTTGGPYGPSTTVYNAIGGNLDNISGGVLSEVSWECTSRDTYTMSNFTANVSSNTITANTVFTFRKNAGVGNQTFTYGSGATGVMSDTTNTDVLAATDSVDHQFITGASGSQIAVVLIEVWTNLGAGTLYTRSISDAIQSEIIITGSG